MKLYQRRSREFPSVLVGVLHRDYLESSVDCCLRRVVFFFFLGIVVGGVI